MIAEAVACNSALRVAVGHLHTPLVDWFRW